MKNREEDNKQKTKNIKITVENTKYLKNWLNNYLFIKKKSWDLSWETQRTYKKIQTQNQEHQNNCKNENEW